MEVAVVVEVGIDAVVGVDVVVLAVVTVGVDVVLDAAHDAKSNDMTMIQVNVIQITPLFIWASFIFE